MKKSSLEKIQEVFIADFSHIPLKIPDENLNNRRNGSMPYGSGSIFYVFDEEAGREYLEYYAYHRIRGDTHKRIYDDGEPVSLPTLETAFSYNPEIPGDKERRMTESAAEYRKTLDYLTSKGMFSSGSVPGSLVINSYIMANGLRARKSPRRK